MLKGVRPAHLYPSFAKARREESKLLRKANASLSQFEDPSLILLHGYCAKDNPFTRTSPVYFSNYIPYTGFLKQSVLNNV